jgi:vacuolar-type H+-ATPase subunit C/Vma6
MIEGMISAPDFESALKIAQKTYGSTIFGKASTPEETIANAQRSFRKELYKHAYLSIIQENFTIEAPLALMVQKEIETRNLETIALGIENASKPEDIESTLILPG